MSPRSRLAVFAALLAMLLISACANVEIRKDDPAKDYPGPRFYLPRPYIVVLKPFPVAQKSWLVPGKATAEGVIVSLEGLDSGADDDLKALFGASTAAGTSGELRFAIAAPTGGAIRSTSGTPTTPSTDPLPTDKNPTTHDTPDGGTATGWVKKGDLSELRDAVNDLYEIRYLPDLEERYVIVSEANLGQASLDAYLAKGWFVQHYGKTVDRRALGKFVFSNIQTVLDLARNAAQAAAGLPGATNLVQTSGGAGAAAAAKAESVAHDCVVKLTITEMAVPGVYPILKPSELAELGGGTKTFQIAGSIQQEASLALPVAYRTTQHLGALLLSGTGQDESGGAPAPGRGDASHQQVPAALTQLLKEACVAAGLAESDAVVGAMRALTNAAPRTRAARIRWARGVEHDDAKLDALVVDLQARVDAVEDLKDIQVSR